MIRTTVKLDSETIEAIAKALDHMEPPDSYRVRAAMKAAWISYHHPPGFRPRFPISHPFKRGGWDTK